MSENKNEMRQGRGGFSAAGFLLAAAGSAVGLGNIWRFPYMAGTMGGGAFVLIYVICMAVIGVPLLLCEFTVGRFGRANAIDSYGKINKATKFIPYIGLYSSPFVLSYYSILSGWTIYYCFRSFTGLYNTPASEMANTFYGYVSRTWTPLLFHLIFMIMCVYIIARGVKGGIEKYSKILMPILFIFLAILVVRSLTLSGAGVGLTWFLKPDFSAVTPGTFVAAAGQVFFSLSIGMSGMVTYASYLSGKENLIKSTGIIAFFDCLVALMAGLVIFPAVFTYGLEPGAGPGLLFITLPSVFSAMPLGQFFSFIFFALLIIANLTSAISILEMPVAYLIEKKGMKRPHASMFIGGLAFLIGIVVSLGYGVLSHVQWNDMSILEIFDYIESNILLPFCGFASAIVVGYIWNKGAIKEISNDGTVMVKTAKAWHAVVRYVIPVVMFFVILSLFGILNI